MIKDVIIDTQMLIWLAVFIGVLTRTLLPYLRKLKEAQAENKTIAFDMKYVYTMVIAVITSIAVANMLVLVIPPEVLETVGARLFVFVFGWAFQHSSNDMFNEMIAT